MPLLSLPLPTFPFFNYHLIPAYFPLRVHLPIGKIPSIIPTNSFKEGMLALFEIAWKNKVRLPVLITVCFLAFDIRLQLEINIFWEEPQRPQAQANRHNRQREATAIIIQRRQRQRVFHERADQIRRDLEDLMREATEVRLRNRLVDQDDGATISGEEQTTTSDENGQGLGKEDRMSKRREKRRRLRKKYKSTNQSKAEDEEDSSEDENTSDSDEDDEDSDFTSGDEDDDDDDDNNDNHGAGDGPGFFNADDFDDNDGSLSDSDNDDDDDDSDSGTPLVVELEIRQRPGLKVLTDKLCLFMQNSLNVFEIFKQEIIEGVPLARSLDSMLQGPS